MPKHRKPDINAAGDPGQDFAQAVKHRNGIAGCEARETPKYKATVHDLMKLGAAASRRSIINRASSVHRLSCSRRDGSGRAIQAARCRIERQRISAAIRRRGATDLLRTAQPHAR
jgi:hypothetical protein